MVIIGDDGSVEWGWIGDNGSDGDNLLVAWDGMGRVVIMGRLNGMEWYGGKSNGDIDMGRLVWEVEWDMGVYNGSVIMVR